MINFLVLKIYISAIILYSKRITVAYLHFALITKCDCQVYKPSFCFCFMILAENTFMSLTQFRATLTKILTSLQQEQTRTFS